MSRREAINDAVDDPGHRREAALLLAGGLGIVAAALVLGLLL